MNAFHFGSSKKRLFGVFHPASSFPRQATAVVLCNATHTEYFFAHRAFRALAAALARRNFPVLRFDYFASGDSAGRSEESSIQQWKNDVLTAVDELKDTAGVDRVSLVGVRLGGALAAFAAAQCASVARVVLWDPVVHGHQYLDELKERHTQLMNELVTQPSRSEDGHDGLCGFPLMEYMRTELIDLRLCDVHRYPKGEVYLASSGETPQYTELARHLSREGVDLVHRVFSSQKIWEDRDLDSNELVPAEIIEQIVEWLSVA